MKNLILSLSLLCLLLGGAVLGTALVRAGLAEMQTVTRQEMPPKEQVQTLSDAWKKREVLFCISMPHDELVSLEEGLSALKGASDAQDEKEYRLSLTAMQSILDRLYKVNMPSLPYIL